MTTRNLHDCQGKLVILLALLMASPASLGEAWHCAADVATAYRYDPVRNRWQTLVLAVQDQRFLVRRSTIPAGRWELVRELQDSRPLPCAGDFDGTGLLRCGDVDQFEMNRNALTFTSHLFGAGESTTTKLTAETVTGRCEEL